MTTLRNAQIVLPDSVLHGSLTIENGRISTIADAPGGKIWKATS